MEFVPPCRGVPCAALGTALGTSLPGEEQSRVLQVSVRKHHTGFQAAAGRAPAASFHSQREAKCLQISLTSHLPAAQGTAMSHRCPQGPPSPSGQPLCPRAGSRAPQPHSRPVCRCWTRSAVAVRPVHTQCGNRSELGSCVMGCAMNLPRPGGLPLCQGWTDRMSTVGVSRGWNLGCRRGGTWQRCSGTVPRMGGQGAAHPSTHSRLLLLPGPSGLQMLPVAGAGSHATHGVPSLSCSSP